SSIRRRSPSQVSSTRGPRLRAPARAARSSQSLRIKSAKPTRGRNAPRGALRSKRATLTPSPPRTDAPRVPPGTISCDLGEGWCLFKGENSPGGIHHVERSHRPRRLRPRGPRRLRLRQRVAEDRAREGRERFELPGRAGPSREPRRLEL